MRCLRRFFREGRARDATCWALVLCLTIRGALMDQAQAQCVSHSRPQADPSSEAADHEMHLAVLERIFKGLEQAAKEIPRETFDPKAVVEKVGADPIRLFEWVRDSTYLVPYQGVLRDYKGVLMDRLGNSVDRALLLYTLCRVAGVAGQDLRLAHAELTDEEAARVLDQARRVPKGGALGRPPAGHDEVTRRIEELNRGCGLDVAALQEAVTEVTRAEGSLREDLAGRVAAQTQALLGLLQQHPDLQRPAIAEERGTARAEAVAALRDHWWVQLKAEAGWNDLDPTLPAATPGQTLRESTLGVPTGKIDETLRSRAHEIVLRVVIERWNEGVLEEAPVFQQPLLPCAFVGKRLVLHHAPLNWPQDLDLYQEKDPIGKLKATAVAQSEWLPVLSVDGQRVAQNAFTDRGDITKPKKLPTWVKAVATAQKFVEGFEAGAAAAAGRVGGILSGGRIGASGVDRGGPPELPLARKPAPGSVLTAEWIEYEVKRPGEEPRRIRREVFDLLGPAARWAARERPPPAPHLDDSQRLDRGLALLGETEVQLLTCGLSPEYVAHANAENVLATRQPVLALLRGAGSAANPPADNLTPRPNDLHGLAVAGREWSAHRDDVYVDRVNILSLHQYVRADKKGDVLFCRAFDIVTSGMGISVGSGADPFLVRFTQGVLDTNVEALLLSQARPVENTAALFTAAEAQKVPWVVIRGGDDATLAEVALPPDARARIREDLAAGYIVIAPRSLIRLDDRSACGWWRLDPKSGEVLGMGERGWGQSATEYFLSILGSVAFSTALTLWWCHKSGIGIKSKACLETLKCVAFVSAMSAIVLTMLLGGGFLGLLFGGGVTAAKAAVFKALQSMAGYPLSLWCRSHTW